MKRTPIRHKAVAGFSHTLGSLIITDAGVYQLYLVCAKSSCKKDAKNKEHEVIIDLPKEMGEYLAEKINPKEEAKDGTKTV